MTEILLPNTVAHGTDTFARSYILTINNPELNEEQFYEYCKSLNGIRYFIFQKEKGQSGTKHFQVFIDFKIKKRFSTMRRYFPRAHIEIRRGTKTQAREYCSKKETRIGKTYEFGTFIEERKRTDLKEITNMLESGKNLAEIRKKYPTQFLMYQKKIESYQQEVISEKQEKNWRNLEVSYIYGTTGTGKTRSIMEKYGYENVYRVIHYDQRAFDGYKGQQIIVFDEFRSSFKITDMLNYLDGYPILLPCRYNDKPACYLKVYIITNIALNEQYQNTQINERETWLAFLRIINNVYNFDVARHKNALLNNERISYDTNNPEFSFNTHPMQRALQAARHEQEFGEVELLE